MNQLLTVSSAAELLAISPWTVRAYIRQGKLNPIRIGRLVRLDEVELVRFTTSSASTHAEIANQASKAGV
jgi:excisionase family DNA binding protein